MDCILSGNSTSDGLHSRKQKARSAFTDLRHVGSVTHPATDRRSSMCSRSETGIVPPFRNMTVASRKYGETFGARTPLCLQ